jgi:hypothetical protein
MAGLLALAVLSAGCAAVRRPPATVASLERDAVAAAASEEALSDSIVERLARRVRARGDRTIDILLLSGGGQNGAYGAGFLRGWKARAVAPMPTFDLVTGVSTGALQSPFAFLGSQAALDTMSALYLRSAERFAPTLDWLFWLRRTGGLVNTTRFRRTLETVLDSTMRSALLAEFRDGRQLVISTTDLDLATGRSWDLSRELTRADDGLPRVRQLLLTSSSIPGIFPPQVIDGRVHADGGLIANVHPGLSLPQYERLAARVKALGFTEPVTVRLWVIMNLWVHAPATVMDPANRKALSARTTLVLFWAQQSQLLQRLAELTRAVNASVDGLQMEMRYTDIPAAVANDPAASKLFSREFMVQLERLGFERATSASPWTATLPSPYQRPR